EGETQETVRIGVFEPLSGSDKEGGELEKMGIELAHDLYPEVLGKKVELIYADNKSDSLAAEDVAKDLAKRKPAVVLGSYGNALTLMGSDVFKAATIPAIAITCSNPLVTSSSEYYFRACYVESFQATATAKYAVDVLKAQKAAILKETENDYATEVAKVFASKFQSLTNQWSIVNETEYTTGSKDFKSQLQAIKNSKAQVLFLPGSVEDTAKIMKQAKEINLDIVFLGIDEWEDKKLVELGGKAVEGACFSTYFDSNGDTNKTTDLFLKAFHEKYGGKKVPEAATVLAFDAYLMAIDAINQAGTAIDGEAVKDKLKKTKQFEGASGNITFDPTGDPVKSVFIKEIKDGKFIHAYTSEPVWGPIN
ncbi:MAG: ABC transporter substrate-binding protein, partial [Anaerovorax sp.]